MLFSHFSQCSSLVTRRPSFKQFPVLVQGFSRHYASKSFAPTPPAIASLETQSDMNAARQWAEAFRRVSIPRETVELTFSRSSGPGGQVRAENLYLCEPRC